MIDENVHFGGFSLTKNKSNGKMDLCFKSNWFNTAFLNPDAESKTDHNDNMKKEEALLVLGLFVLSFGKEKKPMGQFDSYTAKKCYDKGSGLKHLLKKQVSEGPTEDTLAVQDIWKVCAEN